MSGAPGHGRQRGVALLNALVIIAVVAAVAVRLAEGEADLRGRTELMMRADQSRQYALSAEALAIKVLERDWEDDDSIDHLGEVWASDERLFRVDEGSVRGRIIDLQGRLNLNSLEDEEGALDPAMLAALGRLLARTGADRGAGDRVAEWILGDGAVIAGARGDRPYASRPEPFRRALAPMAGASELRPLDGVGAAAYTAVRPMVTALPVATAINVNTAPAEVLAALAPGLSLRDVGAAIAGRRTEPFTSPGEFIARLSDRLSPRAGEALSNAPLTVKSEWFAIEIEARTGPGRATLYSIVHRSDDDGDVTVHLRLEGPP